jgi:hypothetical protein
MNAHRMIIAATIAAAAALTQGCASYLVVQGRNAELDRRAVQLSAAPGGAQAAIDLLGLKGYWQAWMAEPAKMTGATILDLGAAAGAAYLVQEASKDDAKPETKVDASGNSGTIIITGDDSPVTHNPSVRTGGAE